ncbi:hypothetical protein JL722_10862 [Aureococcus anophagefferens]|nr:hypothetical protein JL722_10862 [Aureococcus anophagefferens]
MSFRKFSALTVHLKQGVEAPDMKAKLALVAQGALRPYVRRLFYLMEPYRTYADHRLTVQRTNEAMAFLAAAPARLEPRRRRWAAARAKAAESTGAAESLFFKHAYKIYGAVIVSYWGVCKAMEKPEPAHPMVKAYGKNRYRSD